MKTGYHRLKLTPVQNILQVFSDPSSTLPNPELIELNLQIEKNVMKQKNHKERKEQRETVVQLIYLFDYYAYTYLYL